MNERTPSQYPNGTPQLSLAANDPKAGMTIGELYSFTTEALFQNIDPRTPVKIEFGWRQQIQSIRTAVRIQKK